MSLVLSLFPGIGLLDMAFEEAGFCVVRGHLARAINESWERVRVEATERSGGLR